MEAGCFACSFVDVYRCGVKLEEVSFSDTLVRMYQSKFKIEAADALVRLYCTVPWYGALRRALVFNSHAFTLAGA